MRACRNRLSSIHFLSSTRIRCIIAICPAGPPKLVNPILVQLDKTAGTFTYERRAGTGLTYRILTSETLQAGSWEEDLTAVQSATPSGDNETGYLETLDEIVTSGKVPAQRLVDAYYGEWGEDVSQVYRHSF